jgi:undecaprenyl-diphosphatase
VRLLIVVLVALAALPIILYGALWIYRFAVSQLGPFAPLAVVGGAAVVSAILGPWLLIRYGRPLQSALLGAARLLWTLAHATGLPQWLGARFPQLSSFLRARFASGSATGLGLTIGLSVGFAVTFAALVNLVELLFEVTFGTRVVATDRRVLNLVATLRLPELDQVMYAITSLGNAQTIVVLLAAALGILLLARNWRGALLLLLATGVAELFMAALKLLVARPRPPLEDARIVEAGFSFPSGHATVSATFYGTLAYLLIRRISADWLKTLIGVAAALIVLAVGVSRVYLGVHYPTDVLAGWALGVFWLGVAALIDTVAQLRLGQLGGPATPAPDQVMAARSGAPAGPRVVSARPSRIVTAARQTASALILLLALGYLARAYQDIPLPPTPPPAAPTLVAADQVPQVVQTQLPHYTEALTGELQEPVSLIFVGSRYTLETAFRAAGWTEAAPFGFQSVTGGVGATIERRPDPAGPVTPSFLGEEPNTLAFSLPVGATFAKRHHIRIWQTRDQTTVGQEIWQATASFDQGFELSPKTLLPTHQIAPDIDAERAFVVASLRGSGDVEQQTTVQLAPPEHGENFGGDPFFTDGQAVILVLR